MTTLVLRYVQDLELAAIGAAVRDAYPIRYWFTIRNQQVRTKPTRLAREKEPKPRKTNQLNHDNHFDRTNKFTAQHPGDRPKPTTLIASLLPDRARLVVPLF